jgi:hypothetical protein
VTINEYPRLCGGTFFTLVLQALRQRMNAREHYDGDSDGLSDPEVLVGLIRVINPAYTDPGKEKLKTIANNFKQGGNSRSVYFPFHDDQVINAFDQTVRVNYQTALNGMIGFVNDFLDMSEPVHKDVNLVRAVVDLIQQDQTIEATDEFYVGPNGEKKKKAALGDLKEVCLPSFLLGVWHYVVVNRKDNNIGKKTYEIWCPSAGGGQRKYTAHMGEGILDSLTTYTVDTKETITAEVVDEPIEDDVSDAAGQDTPPVTQQMVNNNPTFFNINISGGNNSFYQHVDKLTINNGGKQDE